MENVGVSHLHQLGVRRQPPAGWPDRRYCYRGIGPGERGCSSLVLGSILSMVLVNTIKEIILDVGIERKLAQI